MSHRISNSYNGRLSSNKTDILLNADSIKTNQIPKGKDIHQILFNRKYSLQVLFDMIKKFQNDFFSKQNKDSNIKTAKKMLILLQDNLSLMNIEKTKKIEYLKNTYENNKQILQDISFSDKQNKKNKNIKIKEDSNLDFSFVQKKNELNFINFQMENDIKKTDILIYQKQQMYHYMKSIPFFFDTNQEKFCNINYENIENIYEILKTITRAVRDKFISVVKDKMQKELEINALSFQIKSIKDNIINDKLNINKKYIDTEEIIYEETKENNKSIVTNQSKRNSFASNKINLNRIGIGNNSSKNLVKKQMSIDNLLKDKLYKNNIISLFHNNESKNQVNNYLNMNINVNINLNNVGFNKPLLSSSSLEDDADNKLYDYEDQFEVELDDNNKIIMTPIQTKENINDNEN